MKSEMENWYKEVVEVTRGKIIESIHYGAAAVVNSRGEMMATYGDPYAVTYMRSSSKPFQALPFIEMGGDQEYGFSSAEIALICASHSGTDEHFSALQKLQARIGISEANLLCGVHNPLHKGTADAMILRGEKPTPNRHNCSGKHTGFLACAKMLGQSLETYLDLDSPLQQNILKSFSEFCDIPVEKVEVGLDGCSAPTFAIPLFNAALGVARFCDPQGIRPARQQACKKIFDGMTGAPFMVAGPGRFDTLFMEKTGGTILTKTGAEGYQIFGIPPRNGQPGMGIALKIADGDVTDRSRGLVGLEILRQMGLISSTELSGLSGFYVQKLTNWRKLEIGEIRPCFDLKIMV